jgi:hypothetical protein
VNLQPHLLLVLLLGGGCQGTCQPPAPDAGPGAPTGSTSHARVQNRTATATTVYVSFGAGSQIVGWPFCADAGAGVCSFSLGPWKNQDLPSDGKWLNATISFDAPPGCGVSLGELDLGNPSWTHDTADISLVNGWNRNLEIVISGDRSLGPTNGPDANASAYGVFPNGCDVCVARESPPCGMQPCGSPDAGGACGCKGGTQYAPSVPCQESFARGPFVTVARVE